MTVALILGALGVFMAIPGTSRNWQEVALPLPDDLPETVCLRRPMSNMWVGTEQHRRLRIGEHTPFELPGQMSGRAPTNVYLRQDSFGASRYFDELGSSALVNLNASLLFSASLGEPDSRRRGNDPLLQKRSRASNHSPERHFESRGGPGPLSVVWITATGNARQLLKSEGFTNEEWDDIKRLVQPRPKKHARQ